MGVKQGGINIQFMKRIERISHTATFPIHTRKPRNKAALDALIASIRVNEKSSTLTRLSRRKLSVVLANKHPRRPERIAGATRSLRNGFSFRLSCRRHEYQPLGLRG